MLFRFVRDCLQSRREVFLLRSEQLKKSQSYSDAVRRIWRCCLSDENVQEVIVSA